METRLVRPSKSGASVDLPRRASPVTSVAAAAGWPRVLRLAVSDGPWPPRRSVIARVVKYLSSTRAHRVEEALHVVVITATLRSLAQGARPSIFRAGDHVGQHVVSGHQVPSNAGEHASADDRAKPSGATSRAPASALGRAVSTTVPVSMTTAVAATASRPSDVQGRWSTTTGHQLAGPRAVAGASPAPPATVSASPGGSVPASADASRSTSAGPGLPPSGHAAIASHTPRGPSSARSAIGARPAAAPAAPKHPGRSRATSDVEVVGPLPAAEERVPD